MRRDVSLEQGLNAAMKAALDGQCFGTTHGAMRLSTLANKVRSGEIAMADLSYDELDWVYAWTIVSRRVLLTGVEGKKFVSPKDGISFYMPTMGELIG